MKTENDNDSEIMSSNLVVKQLLQMFEITHKEKKKIPLISAVFSGIYVIWKICKYVLQQHPSSDFYMNCKKK